MKNRQVIVYTLIAVITLGVVFVSTFKNLSFDPPPKLIAHAGGGINGLTYMNSREAIDWNYSLGLRYFEIDFSWTADNKLVCIHDWKKSYKRRFKNPSELAPTEAAFLSMNTLEKQTQLSLIDLIQWLKTHPDARVVTDIKTQSIEGLKLISEMYTAANQQFVAQIYHPREYQQVKAMGYDRIIYSLYKFNISTEEIISFIANNSLYALAIKKNETDFKTIVKAANQNGLFIYVHTVNDLKLFSDLQEQGIGGIYTDFIYPENNQLVSQ